jgi:hypothetical protein
VGRLRGRGGGGGVDRHQIGLARLGHLLRGRLNDAPRAAVSPRQRFGGCC